LRADVEVFFLMDGPRPGNGSRLWRFLLSRSLTPRQGQTTRCDGTAGNHSPPCDRAICFISHPCLAIIGPIVSLAVRLSCK
jgi:hypothetical protein